MEDAAPQKGIGQAAFVVAGDDHDGPPPAFWLDPLLGVEGVREAVLVEFVQEIVREVARGLVDFVDQDDRVAVRLVRLPECPFVQETLPYAGGFFADSRFFMGFAASRLGPVQIADGIEFVHQVLRGRGRFDQELEDRDAEIGTHEIRCLRLAGAGFAGQ